MHASGLVGLTGLGVLCRLSSSRAWCGVRQLGTGLPVILINPRKESLSLCSMLVPVLWAAYLFGCWCWVGAKLNAVFRLKFVNENHDGEQEALGLSGGSTSTRARYGWGGSPAVLDPCEGS